MKSKHALAAFLMLIVGQAKFPDATFVAAVNDHGSHRLPLARSDQKRLFVDSTEGLR